MHDSCGCPGLNQTTGNGEVSKMHVTSEYLCLECGTKPFKGSHCMCHGLYVTYNGSPYSAEGVRYELVEGKTKCDNEKDVTNCGC